MLKEFNDAPEIPKAVFLTICIFVYEMETSGDLIIVISRYMLWKNWRFMKVIFSPVLRLVGPR